MLDQLTICWIYLQTERDKLSGWRRYMHGGQATDMAGFWRGDLHCWCALTLIMECCRRRLAADSIDEGAVLMAP